MSLDRFILESINLVKKEIRSSIIQTTDKVNCNEVDPDVGKEIINSLERGERKIDSQLTVAQQLVKNGTKEEIMDLAQQTDAIARKALTTLKSLEDLYDISTLSTFETATFFPANSATIPPEKVEDAKKAIEPVAQRIVRFVSDHPHQPFEAVIVCSNTPDSGEQHVKLGELRARSVVNLLVGQIRSKDEFILKPELIRYDIKWVGQREAITEADKERSKVSIIWNLVPVSLYRGAAAH